MSRSGVSADQRRIDSGYAQRMPGWVWNPPVWAFDAETVNAPELGVTESGAGGLAKAAVQLHHAYPKYLGGAVKQELEALSVEVHQAFHAGLDKLLPRQWGAAYYDGLTGAARSQVINTFSSYTRAFDAKYGTSLYESAVKNGLPKVP